MATLRQFYYRVLEDGQFKTSLPPGVSSFFDVNLLNGDSAAKVSIQAPPGTEIQLNNKRIIVGRSGLYDFDNDNVPPITSLVFPQPVRYIRTDVDPEKQTSLEQDLKTINGYLVALIKTRTLIQNAQYFTNSELTENPQIIQQDTKVIDYTEIENTTIASFKFINNQTTFYSSQANFNFKDFCLNGQLIYQGEKNNPNSQYNFDFDGIKLYGFSNVLFQYLKTIQGELTTKDIQIMNVVVNYVTSD